MKGLAREAEVAKLALGDINEDATTYYYMAEDARKRISTFLPKLEEVMCKPPDTAPTGYSLNILIYHLFQC